MKMNFKHNLKELREDRNLTQQQVANVLNVSRSTYTYYEIGRSEPSYESLPKIAKIFNISIDSLLMSESVLRSPTPPYKPSKSMSVDALKNDEQDVIINYRCLSNEDKQKVLKFVIDLKNNNA